ncbi:hypothetical protein GGR50DRAFT_695419 [Xylaria sp. CBS 124048]|nr:hypothetical protein GGR50DRAFT_695419 [Xylaria sp. CBS 124048]
MAAEAFVRSGPSIQRLSADDFDTCSIRSAAPSYVSEAPSYHTLPPNEAVPAYTPAATTSTTTSSSRPSTLPRQPASMLPPRPEPRVSFAPGAGLPPIPRRHETSSSTLSLSQFHIPSWSSIGGNNPQARHYQSVANRRVAAASASAGALLSSSSPFVESALRAAMSRVHAADAYTSEGGGGRIRPLEDPYLVGEEEAARARTERLASRYEEDILILEDQQWDSWLAQMRDAEERERSWNAFRANLDRENNRRKLTRRFGR